MLPNANQLIVPSTSLSMPPKQKSLTVNVIMNVINQVSGVLFPLVTFPYVVRVLQPEGIGMVNFAQAIVSYFIMIASLGIPLYGTREVAKVRDNKQKLSQLVAELFVLNMAMTLVGFAAFAIFMVVSDKAAADPLLFWVCTLPMLLAPVGFNYLFGGLEEFTFVTIRTIAFRLLALAAIFLFINNPSDYRVYALITGLNAVGANLVNLFFARKFLALRKIDFNQFKIRQHLKPISLMALTSIAYTVYGATDITMLGYMTTVEEVGFYAASQKMLMVAVGLISSVIGVLTPRASYYLEKKNHDKYLETTKLSFSLLLTLAVFCMGGMILCAKPAILFFSGGEFLRSIPMLMVSGGSVLVITLYHFLLYQVAYPAGKDSVVVSSLVVGTLLNILLNIVLIPNFHGLGASWATLLSQLMIGLSVLAALDRGGKAIVRPLLAKWVKHVSLGILILLLIEFSGWVSTTNESFKPVVQYIFFIVLFSGALRIFRDPGAIWILKMMIRNR